MEKTEFTRTGLPMIPSEFIEPYLVEFLGNMVQFCAAAREEGKAEGSYWTIEQVKHWLKGLDVFVSQMCGIHSRIAFTNEIEKFTEMDNDDLRALCRKIIKEDVDEEDN